MVSAQAAHPMRRFPPSSTPSLTTLHLTRPLYAQLLHQSFHLPKPFAAVNWLPSSGAEAVKEGSDEWRRRDVGMKVVVGFEMAYDASKRSESQDTATWQDVPFWRRVDQAIGASDAGNDGMTGVAAEDSDAWLTVSESQFDGLMSSKAPTLDPSAGGEDKMDEDEKVAEEQAGKMRDFAQRLEGFVSGKGAFEGATMDEDSDDSSDEDDDKDSEQEDLAADLDMLDDQGKVRPGKGKRAKMEAGERRKRMDGLVQGLEEGEWGAKVQTNGREEEKQTGSGLEEGSKGKETGEVEMVDAEIGSSAAMADVKTSGDKTKTAPPRVSSPRLARPTYDGVVDDSSDEEGDEDPDDPFRPGGPGLATIDEQDVVEKQRREEEEGEVDMGGEEEEFLAFARDALGLTEEQYEGILESRRKKGCTCPAPLRRSPAPTNRDADVRRWGTAYVPAGRKTSPAKPSAAEPARLTSNAKRAAPEEESTAASPLDKGKGKAKGKGVRFTEPSEAYAIPPSTHTPSRATQADRNPNLATFDALMERMDSELQKQKQRRGGPLPSMGPDLGVDSGSEDDDDEGGDEGDYEAAMDAELSELLKKGGANLGGEGEGTMDYGLVANFLESFKAQAGMAGPVGNLAGLMGVDLPAWKE